MRKFKCLKPFRPAFCEKAQFYQGKIYKSNIDGTVTGEDGKDYHIEYAIEEGCFKELHQLIVGSKYQCIKDVVMLDKKGEIAFIKGKLYEAISETRMKNEQGREHIVIAQDGSDEFIKEHFVEVGGATEYEAYKQKLYKGRRYRCKEEAIMRDGKIAFVKGKVYTAVSDTEILNELGQIHIVMEENRSGVFLDRMFDKVDVSDDNISEVFNPQPHYDNSKGSLYKIATERGWNAYIFDIVKRLERGGKKDPIEQEIDKTIDVLKLWKTELK